MGIIAPQSSSIHGSRLRGGSRFVLQFANELHNSLGSLVGFVLQNYMGRAE